jgi:hypothetical protein
MSLGFLHQPGGIPNGDVVASYQAVAAIKKMAAAESATVM